MTGEAFAWECEVDFALGQARAVLERATKAYIDDSLPSPAEGVELAEAWRDLASAWQVRLETVGEPEEDDATPEEEPSAAESDVHGGAA